MDRQREHLKRDCRFRSCCAAWIRIMSPARDTAPLPQEDELSNPVSVDEAGTGVSGTDPATWKYGEIAMVLKAVSSGSLRGSLYLSLS